jgi:hypothetical protein
MVSRLFSWLSGWLPSRRGFRVVAIVDAADEIPDDLPRMGAVLVGTTERPTWLAFDCPCRDHHRVMLNLDRNRRPTWAVIGTKPLTVRPSIDEYRGAERCHYFIRQGRVQWVPYNENFGESKR